MSVNQTVAVVGTGRMGAAMAATLRRAGFDVVVHNRTEASARRVADEVGAAVAATAREAAAAADVVVVSLADDQAVLDVYQGPDGLIAGLSAGKVVAETSTIDPGTISALAPAVAATGASLLDSPVSGSVSLVEQGKLTIMAGGDAEALAVATPALEALSGRIFHMGPNGTGATMKLAVNALVHGINMAVSESLVLAERCGVDRALAYEVFMAGAGGAPFVLYKRDAFVEPETAPVAFSLDLVAKDLRLILGLADRVGLSAPQAVANLSIAQAAIAEGLGGSDMSAVAEYLRS